LNDLIHFVSESVDVSMLWVNMCIWDNFSRGAEPSFRQIFWQRLQTWYPATSYISSIFHYSNE